MDFVELLPDGLAKALRESLIIPTAGTSEIPFRVVALKIFHLLLLKIQNESAKFDIIQAVTNMSAISHFMSSQKF